MDFKEYLLTQKIFSLSALASLMWPKNKSADTYLSKKLRGLDGRVFTAKDEDLAREKLCELGVQIIIEAKSLNDEKADTGTN